MFGTTKNSENFPIILMDEGIQTIIVFYFQKLVFGNIKKKKIHVFFK